MLYPVIASQMDTNITIIEKIDPLTILGRAWALKTSIRSLKLVETNSELKMLRGFRHIVPMR
jgi:lipid-A-disaccharide synthase-like uncharacterized protein